MIIIYPDYFEIPVMSNEKSEIYDLIDMDSMYRHEDYFEDDANDYYNNYDGYTDYKLYGEYAECDKDYIESEIKKM